MSDQILRIKDSLGNIHDLAFEITGTSNYGLLTVSMTPESRFSFGTVVGVAPGATATVASFVASDNFRVRGFNATGNGDGYFWLELEDNPIISGRIDAMVKTISPTLVYAAGVIDGHTVVLKVRNEASVSCDFEGTVIGE